MNTEQAQYDYDTLVLKFGTQELQQEGALAAIVDEVSDIKERVRHVTLISSGAVRAGRDACEKVMGPVEKGDTLREQILSARGQIDLMREYELRFNARNLVALQGLLQKEDFHHAPFLEVYEEIRKHPKFIPIFNENDLTSRVALKFTDNDELQRYLAQISNADMAINFSSCGGLRESRDSDVIFEQISHDYDWSLHVSNAEPGENGRGGISQKMEHMTALAKSGIPVHIAKYRSGVLRTILFPKEGEEVPGTRILPSEKPEKAAIMA